MYDQMAAAWFAGIESVVVPEPSTVVLATFVFAGLLVSGRRRAATSAKGDICQRGHLATGLSGNGDCREDFMP